MAKKKVSDVSNVSNVPNIPDVAPVADVAPVVPPPPAHGAKSEAILGILRDLGFPDNKVANSDVVRLVEERFGLEVTPSLVAVKKTSMKKAKFPSHPPASPSEPTLSELVAFKRRMASEGLDLEGLRQKVDEVEALAEMVGGFERLKQILEAYEELFGS